MDRIELDKLGKIGWFVYYFTCRVFDSFVIMELASSIRLISRFIRIHTLFPFLIVIILSVAYCVLSIMV